MWLIDTRSMRLVPFLEETPKYAILSHTWDHGEVSFQDMSSGPTDIIKAKKGYSKIEQTCRIALENNYNYAWVDTCCIDKSSSAELSEAINSMFRWYKQAGVCYVYLSDLDAEMSIDDGFPQCRWFTRGWTLQELLAPEHVVFFDSTWQFRTQKSLSVSLISKITRIGNDDLSHRRPCAAARVMFWASRRQTTRTEDMAYCLLGLLGINMPLLYGEGSKAFIRLQEEILRTGDLSIFHWPSAPNLTFSGLLADSPQSFENNGDSILYYDIDVKEVRQTRSGLRLETLCLEIEPGMQLIPHYLFLLSKHTYPYTYLVLQKNKDCFVRDNSINGGIALRHENTSRQRLYLDYAYFATYDSTKLDRDDWNRLQKQSIKLRLTDDLRVFDAVPLASWCSAHSLLAPIANLVITLGLRSSPYYSAALLLISRYMRHKLYFISASSPAMPYILSNIQTVSEQEISHYFGLSPSFSINRFDSPPDVIGVQNEFIVQLDRLRLRGVLKNKEELGSAVCPIKEIHVESSLI